MKPVKINANNVRVRQMESDQLGRYVANQTIGVFHRVEQLRPLYVELWKRFDQLGRNETILGCHTKTEYCAKILHKTIRSVQHVLSGRAPKKNQLDQPFEKIRFRDYSAMHDFVPGNILDSDDEKQEALEEQLEREQQARDAAEYAAWAKSHPEEARKRKEQAKQWEEVFKARLEEAARKKQEWEKNHPGEKYQFHNLRQTSNGQPPAADIKEFANLGRRAAANKYHPDRGGSAERMAQLNHVADWIESLAGTAA